MGFRMGIPMRIHNGDSHGNSYGDSHRISMGMGTEIPFPRQPCTENTRHEE